MAFFARVAMPESEIMRQAVDATSAMDAYSQETAIAKVQRALGGMEPFNAGRDVPTDPAGDAP